MRLNIFLIVCLATEIYSDDRKGKPQLVGLLKPSRKIIGGQNAHPGQFPYLVAIQSRTHHHGGHTDEQECGGAIIDARWILTAAHCYEPGDILVIKAGKHDITKKEHHEQVVFAKKFIANNYQKETIKNDIALILLETPLKLNAHVAKIDLPAKDSEPTGHAILSGWGNTSPHKDAPHSAILQTVTMPILDNETCNKLAHNVGHTIINSQICAKGIPAGVGGCSGDSGGPLVMEKEGRKEVVGIFSWAVHPCGRTDSLDVFTKVSAYIHWIQSVMDDNKHE